MTVAISSKLAQRPCESTAFSTENRVVCSCHGNIKVGHVLENEDKRIFNHENKQREERAFESN